MTNQNKLKVTIAGCPRSGKTQLLKKIAKLVELEGYEIKSLIQSGINTEEFKAVKDIQK